MVQQDTELRRGEGSKFGCLDSTKEDCVTQEVLCLSLHSSMALLTRDFTLGFRISWQVGRENNELRYVEVGKVLQDGISSDDRGAKPSTSPSGRKRRASSPNHPWTTTSELPRGSMNKASSENRRLSFRNPKYRPGSGHASSSEGNVLARGSSEAKAFASSVLCLHTNLIGRLQQLRRSR